MNLPANKNMNEQEKKNFPEKFTGMPQAETKYCGKKFVSNFLSNFYSQGEYL